MRTLLSLAIIGLIATPAAAITVDGELGGEYGPAIVTQPAGGGGGFGSNSGLDAAHGQIEGGNLNLFIVGNLSNDFNKLNIFLDSQAGGQNVIDQDTDNAGTNPVNDVQNADGIISSALQRHSGATFDSGFEADFYMILRHGDGGSGQQFDVDFVRLGDGAAGDGGFTADGSIFGNGFNAGVNNSATTSDGIAVGFNNSLNGSSGFELSIPLSLIGNPSSVDVTAFIGGGTHQFASNEFLGPLPAGQSNLGSDGSGTFIAGQQVFDLNNFTGDQFFTVVPEPASLALVGMAVMGLMGVRRRS